MLVSFCPMRMHTFALSRQYVFWPECLVGYFKRNSVWNMHKFQGLYCGQKRLRGKTFWHPNKSCLIWPVNPIGSRLFRYVTIDDFPLRKKKAIRKKFHALKVSAVKASLIDSSSEAFETQTALQWQVLRFKSWTQQWATSFEEALLVLRDVYPSDIMPVQNADSASMAAFRVKAD